MRCRRLDARAGTTLVEVTLGVALLAVFSGAAFLALDGSARSYGTGRVVAQLDLRARAAMDDVSDLLLAADFDSLTPAGVVAPASVSTLDFQRARGFAGGAVEWGPTERLLLESEPGELENGIDDDGDGTVDEGRLVLIEDPGAAGERRLVLCSQVSAALEGEILANGEDDNGNGLIDERGFCIASAGRRLEIRLTLEARDQRGSRILCSSTRSATPRNTPEE